MWTLNYDSISELDSTLKSKGLAMSKKFGQNFLISSKARERIVDYMALEDDMRVWEVGPGLGAITHLVLKKNVDLTAFEIDYGFAEILKEEAFKDEPRFSLVIGDALKTLFEYDYTPDRIIGNLPYNVGSVIIAKLIESSILPELMVFTLQSEVVERMCAKPGDDEYSSFSILTQIDYENQNVLTLKKGCFWPQPQVESSVVVMAKRKESLVSNELRSVFLPLVRALFSMRRKTIKNNLVGSFDINKTNVDSVLSKAGLTGQERAEVLTFDEIIRVAEVIKGY